MPNSEPLTVGLAESDADIARCFPVMGQLRPNLDREGFVPRIRAQQREGYHLAYLAASGVVRAVAGYRIHLRLHAGKTIYVDDLVTDTAHRSRGYGDKLFDWLVAHARAQDCEAFTLDSGTHRVDAHRFYLRKRMHIVCFHFSLAMKPAAAAKS